MRLKQKGEVADAPGDLLSRNRYGRDPSPINGFNGLWPTRANLMLIAPNEQSRVAFFSTCGSVLSAGRRGRLCQKSQRHDGSGSGKEARCRRLHQVWASRARRFAQQAVVSRSGMFLASKSISALCFRALSL